MANVFVEPKPKGRPEGSAITHYVLEYKHEARVTDVDYRTQATAIAAAKALEHQPLVARVRNTDKVIPIIGARPDEASHPRRERIQPALRLNSPLR
jgi:hypothetical protein